MIAGFPHKQKPKEVKPKSEIKPHTVMSCDCFVIAVPKRFNPDLDPKEVIEALNKDGIMGRRGFQFIVTAGEVGVEKMTTENAPVTQIQVEMLMSFCRGYLSARRV